MRNWTGFNETQEGKIKQEFNYFVIANGIVKGKGRDVKGQFTLDGIT